MMEAARFAHFSSLLLGLSLSMSIGMGSAGASTQVLQLSPPTPSSSPWVAELSRNSSPDGSIVIVTVHLTPSQTGGSSGLKLDPSSITASLEGTHDIPFFEADVHEKTGETGASGEKKYQAVVAVPFNHPLGTVTIEVKIGSEQTITLPLEVVEGHYRSEVLKVDEERVSPPAEDQARIADEQKEINEIYAQVTRQKFWDGPFAMPVKSIVTSPFGSKRIYNGEMKSFHQGLDLRAKTGKPIKAPAAGRVVLAKNLFFTGNTVLLDHGFGVITLYGHMSKLKVKKGDLVKTGTVLGLAGMTGRANGPHLHWGAIVHGQKVNPLDLTRVMP